MQGWNKTTFWASPLSVTGTHTVGLKAATIDGTLEKDFDKRQDLFD